MKKVILTGAAMMAFAAASFAQNSATLNQVGNTQSGNATQSGNNNTSNIQQTTASGITNTGNYANTTQANGGTLPSNGNTANINQLGTKSGFATTFQEGGSVGNGNTATINQKNNNGGTGVLSLPANPANPAGDQGAVVAQGGNYANTYQQGYNETVTVNQNDNSKSNIATSRQDNFGTGQSVTINQNGGTLGASSNNKATANQFGDSNTLSISQSNNSDNNKADVRQGYSLFNGGPNAFNATATVEQNGGSYGASKNNEATILQTFSGANNATILQNDDSDNNKATVTQSGAVGSTANVSQNIHSYRNEATVSQSAGGGHSATINQIGNSTASSFDNESADNKATATQTGSGNAAIINQLAVDTNGGGVATSKLNQATVTQSGSNDQASILQSDNAISNQATINQTGSSASTDKATIEQITQVQDNKATINQKGSAAGNTAFISQRYSGIYGLGGSTATIDQNTTTAGGNNLSEIYQGRSVASDGIASIAGLGDSYKNTASSSQQGSNNTSRLYQVGHDLKATLTQTGDGNLIQGTGLANFPAYATQYGNNNTLTVSQTSGIGGPGNTANVFQSGSGNAGTITQSTN